MQALEKLLLQHDVENFLAREYELLDERRYDEWLALLSEDLRYWVPLARNFKHGRPQDEYTLEQSEAAWFDEDKTTLGQRVRQIQGGDHWAEEPASRTTHVVAGVRIDRIEGDDIVVKSRMIVYSNRGERESQFFVGKRVDVLRHHGDSYRIARRTIHLDQSVLLAKSITTFF
jgi:3-phenylpropionate/cinnamic acid dioxygenase small subunit